MGCCDSKIPHYYDKPKRTEPISRMSDFVIEPANFVHENPNNFKSVYLLSNQYLGKGLYSEVRICVHRKSQVLRAVKIIHRIGLKNQSDTLFREVDIMKSLDHPHIAQVYETFQDKKNFYIVMEYCPGGELYTALAQYCRFSEKLSAKVIKQICSAVAYCHSRNIIHRDLKLENIMLESRNIGSINCKIIDFDTATFFEVDRQVRGSFGTAYYIAPEVLEGPYNEKCDIWSCGVILYMLLSGRPPFDGDTEEEILEKVKLRDFSFESNEWKNISEDAKDLVCLMLNPNPEERISAIDIVNHPWVQQGSKEEIKEEVVSDLLGKFSSFTTTNKIKDAFRTFIIAQVLAKNELKELSKTFMAFDKDGDGLISKNDLMEQYKEAMSELSESEAENEVESLLKKLDLDKDGYINYTEFIRGAIDNKKVLSQENLKQTFKILNISHSGYISFKQLKEMLGARLVDEDLWQKILDDVGHGQEEFIPLKKLQDIILEDF